MEKENSVSFLKAVKHIKVGWFMVDLRRVQKTGGSTLIISLPKRWTEATGTQNGDTLAIIPGDKDTLILDPHPNEKPILREKHIVLEDDDPEHFFRRLIAVYINGYDTIKVTMTSSMGPEMRSAIRKFTRMVIGPEITEEDINSVHIRDLSDSGSFGIKSVVRRIFRITYSMVNDALDAVKNADGELSRDVVSRDTEVDRLYWLLFKQYNIILKKPRYQQEGLNAEESLNYFLVGRILERVADHGRNISNQMVNLLGKKKRSPLTKQTVERFAEAGELVLAMLDNAFESFLMNDMMQANQTIDSCLVLKEKISNGIETLGSSKPGMLVPISGIFDSVKRAGMYASDIAEIAINSMEQK